MLRLAKMAILFKFTVILQPYLVGERTLMAYFIFRTCNNCGKIEKIPLTKREATFDLVDINKTMPTCPECGSASFNAVSEKPALELELLKEWAADEKLCVLEQDEDLMIANACSPDHIVEVLNAMELKGNKLGILVSALCVIVYDNTRDSGNAALRSQAIDALNQRLELIRSMECYIDTYIAQVVFPQLNL